MLDGKAYKAHFSDDPAYDASIGISALRPIKSTALLAVLAALEDEFKTILNQSASSPTTDTDTASTAL